ncbi:MAG: hypothetical protein M1812_001532 [Candelaria pacifica]|nr:MAG: hypothetical protein M1812_001532 [Candelaria pacifica]
MTQSFNFGFSGDDIDNEEDNNGASTNPISSPPIVNALAEEYVLSPALAPSLNTIGELLSTLPSKISYNTLKITTDAGHNVSIPRRELFDIRLQLMAEDRGDSQALLDGLGTGDITPNVYEGGFKTWECSIDLVKTLLDKDILGDGSDPEDDETHIVELGCGTAIPTMALFQLAMIMPRHRFRFTLADYNYDVLRLVTIPNLLLSWAFQQTARPDWRSDDDLEITQELLGYFISDLKQRKISVEAISGAWGEEFVELSLRREAPGRVLVLASETIYSPTSLGAFTETLLELLKGDGGARNTALVAAKRVYFGVGGGVDEFCKLLAELGAKSCEVPSMVGNSGEGVSRVVLEVSCNAVTSRGLSH